MGKSESKPVLLTVGGHTQRVLWEPLAEHYDLCFMSNQNAAYAESLGIPSLRLESFFNEDMLSDAKLTGLMLSSELIDRISEGEVSFGPGERLHGHGLARWLPGMFFDHAAAAAARTSACQALAEQRDVAGVLVHEDVTAEGRMLALFGNSRGIPTLHIPHANHFLEPGTGDIHCQVTAQHIGAGGEYMRDWYEKCGAEDIEIIGTPRWDEFYDPQLTPSRDLARRGFGILDGQLALGYATTWYQMTSAWGDPEEDLRRACRRVMEAAKTLDAFLLVKMHPGEQMGQERFYSDQMKEAGVSGAITRNHGKYAARAVDCMIVQGPSNYGIQCTILGTSVVELYQCGASYPEDGPAGTWGDGLETLVQEAVAEGPKMEFLRRVDDRAARPATDRAVEWVRSLC